MSAASPARWGRRDGLSRPREPAPDVPTVPYVAPPPLPPAGYYAYPTSMLPPGAYAPPHVATPWHMALVPVPGVRFGEHVLQQCLVTDDDTCDTDTCIERCLLGVRQAQSASWEYLTGDPGYDRGVCLARHAHHHPHVANRLCSTTRLHGARPERRRALLG